MEKNVPVDVEWSQEKTFYINTPNIMKQILQSQIHIRET